MNDERKVLVVNRFVPLQGKLDEFLEVQVAQQRRIVSESIIPGFHGNRLVRALDGSNAMGIALFDSVEAHKQFLATGRFTEHLERIKPLLERVDPGYYQIVYEAGRI